MKHTLLLCTALVFLSCPLVAAAERHATGYIDFSQDAIDALQNMQTTCEVAVTEAGAEFDPSQYLRCTMHCTDEYSDCREEADADKAFCYARAEALSEKYDDETVQMEVYFELTDLCNKEWQQAIRRCSERLSRCMQNCE